MATGDYCTLGELKARIWPDGVVPDDVNDTMFGSMITSVSRMIETLCGRRFFTTSVDETRYFSTDDPEYLFPNVDIVSITTLATDSAGARTYGNTWAATDYDLLPSNAALDSTPYYWIATTPNGSYSFPTLEKAIKIIGKFGWTTQPTAVREACLLQAMRIYKRRDAPFGVISNPAGGDMRLLDQLDPDVQTLLAPYRRMV